MFLFLFTHTATGPQLAIYTLSEVNVSYVTSHTKCKLILDNH